MNLKVNLGITRDKQDFFVDFEKQKIHLTLLVGATGTGKSVLGYHIYRQLIEQNKPDEITFVLLDNIRVEFGHWNQKSPYIYCHITDHNEALEVLEGLANKIQEINSGTKHFFIHIEECDLVALDSQRNERALKQLLAQKENSKVHIIFSTSRPSEDIFTDWLLALADMKVVFDLPGKEYYERVAGKDLSEMISNPTGEKVVLLNNQTVQLLSLTDQEKEVGEKFKIE